MIGKSVIEDLLKPVFESRKDLFLVEINISPSNQIEIVIDGDQPVSIEDCLFISRAVEFNLEREKEDFSLQVSSPGADAKILLPRQYNKLLHKQLEVKTTEGEKFIGELSKLDDSGIELTYSERIPKEKGKGKQTVVKQQRIEFRNIKTSRVILKI